MATPATSATTSTVTSGDAEATRRLAALPRGLSAAEVAERRARGETNAVKLDTSRAWWRILLQNAFTLINTTLFAICIFLAVLGLIGDALMTASLVVINVVVGVFQEVRAKRKLDQIALLTRPTATVLRDGQERTLDPAEIVRGDLLVARPGDQLLVDGRVVRDGGLSVDESLLTGESDLVVKREGDEVFSGSFAMTGSAHYVAEKVGADSMAQQLTGQARKFRDAKTPLQREIGLAINAMIVIALLLGVQVADTFRTIYHDIPLTESVKAAAVIVALVPQGLVFMVTVTYAMAAVRMAGKGALIQRMNAVESTSQIDVLCLDKTGTLTTNQLVLHALDPLDGDEAALRARLARYAATTTAGNRTTDAIRAGCPGEPATARSEAPFSSARKWSALAFDDGVDVLGAPEMLRPLLAAVAGDGLDARIAAWTAQGLRVLLVACDADPAALDLRGDEPALRGGLQPLGLIVIADELRPEAGATIAKFGEAGIALKVISGDSPDTVAALAKQAGLTGDVEVVSGLELDALSDDELAVVAREKTVFGRITPQQKERLVRALRKQKHYVAMIGDGVNDTLALKSANLAIAMRSGSQVTRSVADIVLLNDSFAALPQAFLEGQRILKGMQDIIRVFLVRTLYVAMIIFGTTLMNEAFPVTPKQSGLLAMLTVGIPALFLAAWAKPGVTPRRLIPSSAYFVIPAALTVTGVGLTIYVFFAGYTGDVEEARTALTITTVLCGLTMIPFLEPPTPAWAGGEELSGEWKPTILAGALLAIGILCLAWAPLRGFYELEVLPISAYLVILLVVLGWATALRWLWRARVLERAWLTTKRRARLLRRRLRPGRRERVPATS